MDEKMKDVSVLDLLLKPELPDVRKVLPEKQVKIDRLSEFAGQDVIFRLRGPTYKQVRETQEKPVDERALNIVLEGCVEPNFHGLIVQILYSRSIVPKLYSLVRVDQMHNGYGRDF